MMNDEVASGKDAIYRVFTVVSGFSPPCRTYPPAPDFSRDLLERKILPQCRPLKALYVRE